MWNLELGQRAVKTWVLGRRMRREGLAALAAHGVDFDPTIPETIEHVTLTGQFATVETEAVSFEEVTLV